MKTCFDIIDTELSGAANIFSIEKLYCYIIIVHSSIIFIEIKKLIRIYILS